MNKEQKESTDFYLGYEAGKLDERSRIVELFDVAWAIGGTTGDHLNVAREIIEGLRSSTEVKHGQSDKT